MKDLTAQQAKISLNTRKQFNSDKTIKNKAEADRRMKEVNYCLLSSITVNPNICVLLKSIFSDFLQAYI